MILRHCKACKRDRGLSKENCTCGSDKSSFKAVVVVPGSKGKRRAKSAPTLEGAVLAEQELRNELNNSPLTSSTPSATTPTTATSPPEEASPVSPSPLPSSSTVQPQQQYPPYSPQAYAYGHMQALSCPTFNEIWKSYKPHIELRKRSYKSDLHRWRDYIKKPLGHKPADQIRPADIQAIVDGCIRKGLAGSTTLQVFALVRAMFNYADRLELTIGLPNPCRKVQVPKFDNKVTNPLTTEDFVKLEEACKAWDNKHASRVVLFCAYSGRRMGEVLKLEWDDVNLEEGMVCFRAANTKSGKTQTVPVNDKALEVLKVADENRVSESGNEPAWVFPCSTGKYFSGFHRIWQRIRKNAKLSKHYRFHDLRHTFASTLVSKGVSLYMVKELLGHPRNP